MTKSIALFNNKGGVSKTTTCFNLGWMLAERGHTVIMVDADPQCNLTGMVLDLTQGDALHSFYRDNPGRNLKDALEPAFKSRPRPLQPVDCVQVDGRPGFFLIPGHVALFSTGPWTFSLDGSRRVHQRALGYILELSRTFSTLPVPSASKCRHAGTLHSG